MNDNNTVQTDTIEGIDEFLPMPGADTVVVAEGEGGDKEAAPSMFKRDAPADLSFLDEEKKDDDEDKDKKSDEDDEKDKNPDASKKTEDSTGAADEVIAELDKKDFGDGEDTVTDEKGDKNFITAMKGLIEDETLLPFEDDKPIEDYTKKDWQELIKVNFEEKERALREQTPKEFFEALPQELQHAAQYVAQGGKDMKGMFAALARREEVRELDPSNDDHQSLIARQYLQATKFGDGELIEDQVQEWVETGVIAKKAKQFKPKLDKMQEQILQQDLKNQEQAQLRQKEQKEAYMRNIYDTLKPAELNGIKLTNKRQNMLWNELTTVKYQSMTGKPTNLLGKLLEEYQFSDKPRYDLIAEATWLLSDPEDYYASRRSAVEKEITGDTVKELKTEEGRRLKSTTSKVGEDDDASRKPAKRTVTRKSGNMFKRS
jgi:hypothetical protein